MEDAHPKPASQLGCLHLFKMCLAGIAGIYLLRGSPEGGYVRYGVAIACALAILVLLTAITNLLARRLRNDSAVPPRSLGGIFAADLILSVVITVLISLLGRSLLA